MKISVIIPAYNEALYIGKCLSSIEKNRSESICEVIVVDNGSDDRTSKIVAQFPFVTIISEPKKGASYARQKGLLHATGDLIAFVDADTMITPDWAQKAINEFTTNKNLVALSGPVMYDLSSWHSLLVETYFNICVMPLSKVTGSLILCGNFVVKKDAIMQIGGFDTTIAFYGDDTNIARRLRKVGKVAFKKKFLISTSARRLKEEGIMKTGFKYAINYFSEQLLHKPITKKYTDVR